VPVVPPVPVVPDGPTEFEPVLPEVPPDGAPDMPAPLPEVEPVVLPAVPPAVPPMVPLLPEVPPDMAPVPPVAPAPPLPVEPAPALSVAPAPAPPAVPLPDMPDPAAEPPDMAPLLPVAGEAVVLGVVVVVVDAPGDVVSSVRRSQPATTAPNATVASMSLVSLDKDCIEISLNMRMRFLSRSFGTTGNRTRRCRPAHSNITPEMP
jgi:hypothetical protein